ncbi:response regulator [Nitrincola sp. A-D6]|uniref:response regulator n=1 Tax=Nitrincola sp. A-D6 TaxID=1545442 RepID=UPI001363CAEF|nr:response regulator [Nitrincola sp. A-D6]
MLVVDDDEFQRSVLRKLLMAEHYDVKFAENGLDALEMMRQRQYDLVLLDLLMPGMSGLDVMQQIRMHPGLAAAPVIIISGEHEKETVVECLQLGASGYVVKPYTRKTLLAKIAKTFA